MIKRFEFSKQEEGPERSMLRQEDSRANFHERIIHDFTVLIASIIAAILGGIGVMFFFLHGLVMGSVFYFERAVCIYQSSLGSPYVTSVNRFFICIFSKGKMRVRC
jgi:hypothetical protein